MLPVYFPFTYVSQTTAQVLARIFRQVTVYQASATRIPTNMRQQIQRGLLNVRIPIAIDPVQLDCTVKNFQHWAALHGDRHGLKTALLQPGGNPIAFFDAAAVSQVIADIKNARHHNQPLVSPDLRFCACVFIEVAQEYDRQRDELNLYLETFAEKTRQLFNNMKGEKESAAVGKPFEIGFNSGDSHEHLILKRLEAWTVMFQEDQSPSALYVTTSRAVIEYMMGQNPNMHAIYYFGAPSLMSAGDEDLRTSQDNLLANLASLAKSECPAAITPLPMEHSATGSPATPALTVYVLPDTTPHACFVGSESKPHRPSQPQRPAPLMRNTLIGFMQL